ncbi:MAG: DUF4190 domain-containing protein [Alphaproteobacteria bacterium]|nr:DUF4190 domain-containing protein [Alphaproteobacteria bacterium]
MSEFIHDGFTDTECHRNNEDMSYANPYSPNYDATKDPYLQPKQQTQQPYYVPYYTVNPNEYIYRPYERMANAAFILSLLSTGFPFLAIFGLIFGVITYNAPTMNSEKQLFSRLAVVISIGVLFVSILVLFLAIVTQVGSIDLYSNLRSITLH